MGGIEEFLTNKNWTYLSGEAPSGEILGKAVFTFNKSNYSDQAECFFTYVYSDESGRKRVNIDLLKIDIYNKYITRLKALGYKITESKIKDGEIIKIYKGLTTTIEITILTPKTNKNISKTHYMFFIVENDDYLENFANN